ncbi:MAG: 2-oxoisovalerate dehydrogenase [Pleurocapsa sp. SU_196_0]|nr:2-oxoisovalerate dehydrogenase [Pleurocapsa sp. SU_196_0]
MFDVLDAEEGGFNARALGKAIFTQADTWDELKTNVLEAVGAYFDSPETQPKLIQWHHVKGERVPVNAA